MAEHSMIYLVDDDQDFREATQDFLQSEGFSARAFDCGGRMLDLLDPEWPGVILCDVRMQGMDGYQVLRAARETAPDVPLVMMTGHGDVRMAIAAIKAGAYDYLEKPIQPEYLTSVLTRALRARKLILENTRLRRRVARFGDLRNRLIGTSAAMKACRKALLNVAPLPLTVTIHGAPGTGKELAARSLHDFSEVSGEFQALNCATATKESLAEHLDRVAQGGGTLFFRAAHCLPPDSQSVLAEFMRIRQRPRVVISVTGAPGDLLAEGALTEELFYLINVASVEMPPLRERDKDLFLLLEHFLREAAARFDKKLPHVTREMLAPLRQHNWPGNVRELRSIAERMVIGLPVELEKRWGREAPGIVTYDIAMQEFERGLLEQALAETNGRKGAAADLLAIPRKRFYLRMKAVGLSPMGKK